MERARSGFRLPESLPPLQGLARAVFLAVWAALLIVAFLGSVMAARDFLHGEYPATDLAGISIYALAPDVTLGPPIGDEAASLGIRRGDRLLRIDGAPAPKDWPLLLAALSGPEGSTVTLDTLSAAGQPMTHVLTRGPHHFEESLHAAGLSPLGFALLANWSQLFLGGVLIIVCAVLLMIRRSREALAPWASLMLLLGACSNSPAAEWFGRQGHLSNTFTMFANAAYLALLVATLAIFPEGRFRPWWSWLVVVFGSLAMALTWDWEVMPANLVLVVCVAFSLSLIGIRFRTLSAGLARQQVRWVMMGFMCSLVALLALVAFQAMKHRMDTHPAFIWMRVGELVSWSLMIALIALGMTIALLRYRLYDADAAISRSAAYGALTVGLLAVFAGTQRLIESLGDVYLGESLGALSGGLAAAAAAIVIGPLKRATAHWAEKRFEPRLFELRHELPLLVADLRETNAPEHIASVALARTVAALRAKRGALVLHDRVIATEGVDPATVQIPRDDSGVLSVDHAGSAFPVRLRLHADGIGDAGWLLLGPRPDDSLIGKDERVVLREIGDPLARALLVSTERQAALAAMEARFTAIERRLADLATPARPALQAG